MKSLLVTFVVLQFCCLASAQEVAKKKEVGIVFWNLDSFGATFRVGNSNSLWRYSAFVLSGNNSKNTDTYNSNLENTSSSFGTRIAFGKEFRKGITEKFYFRYGADISVDYSTSENENINTVTSEFTKTKSTGYAAGLNLVLGVNYSLSENFLVGVELLPYARYRDGSTKLTSTNGEPNTSDYSGFSYGLTSSSLMLSLVYRW